MDHRIDRCRLVVLVAVGCLTACGPWDDADEFQQRLYCGMDPTEVNALAEEMGVTSFRPIAEPHEFTSHVLNQDRTFFEFYFGDDGLETVRQGASVGWTTGTSYEPRMNLCTGEVTDDLMLTLKGSETLAGAAIFVDDEPRWQLPTVPEYRVSIAIPTGPHEIRIEQEGYEPIVIPVDYGAEVESEEIELPSPKPSPDRGLTP